MNYELLSIIVAIIACVGGAIWPLWSYVLQRKKEHQLKEFENYHKLMKELVQPEFENSGMYVDRQTAILFEFRHLKRYYPISYRTIIGLKEKWDVPGQFPRLMDECNRTIAFLEKRVQKTEK